MSPPQEASLSTLPQAAALTFCALAVPALTSPAITFSSVTHLECELHESRAGPSRPPLRPQHPGPGTQRVSLGVCSVNEGTVNAVGTGTGRGT